MSQSLYKEASRILLSINEKKGTVKNLVLSSKYKNKKQLFALVCETLKYKSILMSIIEATKLQKSEKILRQENLVLVLIYDFLIGQGFSGPTDQFKAAVLKHKAALQSELARLKVKANAKENADLLPSKIRNEASLPRYVRVNTLVASVEDVIDHFKREDFKYSAISGSYESFITAAKSLKKKQFLQDPHIPELLAFASGTDLHNHVLYENGSIIFQDKASCLPAFVLNPTPGSHVIDCCAAPGNKTSHLAAILQNKGKLFAFDKDLKRVTTMNTMLLKAGVLCTDVTHGDFLKTNPLDAKYKRVEYILVDPSCSGSGIVNRLNEMTDDADSSSTARLQNLAKFQVEILSHALTFPNVKKVVYSTCSTHQVENEAVVCEALRIVENSFKVISVLKDFPNRGQELEDTDVKFPSQRCIRLTPEADLTNGFFIACLKKVKETEDLIGIRLKHLLKISPAKSTVQQDMDVTPKVVVKEHVGKQKQKRTHEGVVKDDVPKGKSVKSDKADVKSNSSKGKKKQKKSDSKPEKKVLEFCSDTSTVGEIQHKGPVVFQTVSNRQAKQGKKRQKHRNKKSKAVTA